VEAAGVAEAVGAVAVAEVVADHQGEDNEQDIFIFGIDHWGCKFCKSPRRLGRINFFPNPI
jgi:hypothetical protein